METNHLECIFIFEGTSCITIFLTSGWGFAIVRMLTSPQHGFPHRSPIQIINCSMPCNQLINNEKIGHNVGLSNIYVWRSWYLNDIQTPEPPDLNNGLLHLSSNLLETSGFWQALDITLLTFSCLQGEIVACYRVSEEQLTPLSAVFGISRQLVFG